MSCRALWNTNSDEFLNSGVLSEIDFILSTKEAENKVADCIFYYVKFSEDKRGNI